MRHSRNRTSRCLGRALRFHAFNVSWSSRNRTTRCLSRALLFHACNGLSVDTNDLLEAIAPSRPFYVYQE
ncbi:hypothetical protein ACA910_022217 [Epithemia clementina (nom. ined.)]